MDETDATVHALLDCLTRLKSDEPKAALVMWTVYDRPLDFPNSIVARQWIIEGEAPKAGKAIVAQPKNIGMLREAFMRMGLTCLARNQLDEDSVMETWL